MSNKPSEYSQQILFDDLATPNAEQSLDSPNQQVVITGQQWQETPLAEQEELTSEPLPRKKSWFKRILLGTLATILVVELVDFFIQGFAESPILTSIYAIAASAIAAMALSSLWREIKGLKQFKRRQQQQKQAEKVINGDQSTTAITVLCSQITQSLPGDLSAKQQSDWQHAVDSNLSDKELSQLYSRIVLSKVDEKALKEISKFSTESVALIAISPVAIVDMFIMLWRNLRMINKISSLYGLQLGFWSRIELIKQVFVNMAYAGASELLADLGAEMLGADLLGKMSGRLAQGFGAGMLTARLGLKVMKLSRPMPFYEQQPALKHVRREMISQIKSLISKGNN